MKKSLAVVLLAVWLFVLLDMTLLWFPGEHPGRNLLPFRTVVRDLRMGGREVLVNLVGNVAVFVPLGVLLPFTRTGRPTSAWRVAAVAALLSSSIEVAQYASGRRVADVDDITLNTSGAVLGYALVRKFGPPPRGEIEGTRA